MATEQERERVLAHAVSCRECRTEIEDLERLAPPGEWSGAVAGPEPMPENLWRAISKSRASLAVRLRIRLGHGLETVRSGLADAAGRPESAGGGSSPRSWVSVAEGRIELMTLSASPVRAGRDGSSRDLSRPAPAARVRAIAGPHEALLRRGATSLTVIMTSHGVPAEGRSLSLVGSAGTRRATTDSSGACVFRDLDETEYLLDLGGMES
jgi:hypothetical protein